MTQVRYQPIDVDGFEIFYREAGDKTPPTLLLHGFTSSGHIFRDLISLLADRFHFVAPDLPGFGLSEIKPRGAFDYSFDNLAKVTRRFTEVIGLDRYALYVFDYDAPTGFRLAMAHPERVTAIVSQNGNAYEDGLSDGWDPIQRYWRDPSEAIRQALRFLLIPASIRWQYEHGVPDTSLVSPDGSALDALYIHRPGADRIQLDLFRRYATNIALYPAFQAYFREHQPKLLAMKGRNDPFFLPPGAEAFRRDLPTLTCVSSTRAISPWRHMRRRSRRRSTPSSGDHQRRTAPIDLQASMTIRKRWRISVRCAFTREVLIPGSSAKFVSRERWRRWARLRVAGSSKIQAEFDVKIR